MYCLRVKILTLVTIGYSWIHSWDIFIEYCYGSKWPYWIYILHILDCLGQVYADTDFG